jgi:YegS/Rv2252/BmrU family lipid kinase
MSSEHLFIVNPIAGKGRALKVLDKIRSIIRKKTGDFDVKLTEHPGHATEIAREYSKKGVPRIYSVGGDGTLNEVLNGIVGTKSSLGVIPAGSGNDFSRTIHAKADVDEIIEGTISNSSIPVDIVKLNSRYFLNVSSIGFDAEVAYTANRIKTKAFVPGGLSYYLGILLTLGKCQSYRMKIDIDGTCFEDEMLLVAVANGRYYGNGVLPAPMAKIDDGILDVCLVRKKPRLDILRLFPKYAAGKHGDIEGISFHRGKRIHIICDIPVAVNMDGEVERHSEALFEIIPVGVNLLVP